jgi:hypothetical protein
VADEKKGTGAQSLLGHSIKNLESAIRERHPVARVSPASEKPTEGSIPLCRARGIAEGPYTYFGELLTEPMQPRRGVIVTKAPRPKSVPAQAVDKDYIGPPRALFTTGDRVQRAQNPTFSAAQILSS